MNIANFAVNRRVTILMMVLAVVLIGAVSYSRLPVDLLPNMSFPMAVVITDFSGVGPEEVETMVTRPLEGVLGTISNIKEVSSTSSEGRSLILLQFDWNTDMDMIAIDIRGQLDLAKRYLPSGVGTPTLIKFDPSMLATMNVGVASDELNLYELRALAEDSISQRLERIPGVASVTVNGGVEQEFQVDLNLSKLEQYGISISQISNALRAASVNLPGGELTEAGERYLIRTLGKAGSVDDLKDLVVGMETKVETVAPSLPTTGTGSLPGGLPPGVSLPGGGTGGVSMPTTKVTTIPVHLQDVAVVALRDRAQSSVSRLNGQPNVTLSIQKQSDANTVLVANLVKAELDTLRQEYPSVNLLPTMDQARFINITIDNVMQSAVYGGLLAIFILLVFLRNWRSTLVIAISVPVSVIATFILLYFSGLTINLMTLSGLALGIGMLVDNSIVVLESIFRHLELGTERKMAARRGASEVAMAITASTLTTVAVFLPVAFVGGITGTLFKELALTVSFSLICSLAVALTVVPMLSATILGTSRRMTEVGALARTYGRTLRYALSHKLVVSLIVIALFAGSLLTLPRIGGEFLPSMDQGQFAVRVNMSDEATAADLEALVSEIEQKLLADPDVDLVDTTLSGNSAMAMIGMSSSGSSGNTASINVTLKSDDERDRSTDDLVRELRALYENHALADVSVNASQGMMGGGGGGAASMLGGGGVQVDIAGPDLVDLGEYAATLGDKLKQHPNFEEVGNSLSARRPELQVRVDFDKAGALGIAPVMIGSVVRSAFQGETATQITHGGRELSVVVRLRPEDRETTADLKNLVISSAGGKVIRLKDVAEVVEAQGPRQISRRNNQRYVTVTADVVGIDLRGAQSELETMVAELNLPDDYQAIYGGEMKEMQEAFSGLGLALILAIVLVYMVMASQFESVIHPFTVMFTMPLATIGVLYMLFFTGHKLSVTSLIGVIMLAGIVVNNAIVLVDYINQLRSKGKELLEAVVEAGQTRLRPILMTALTTILGLVPLALRPGAGAEMQQPLAIAVIGGLVTATFLTLFIIPIVYTVFDRLLPKATNIVHQDELEEGTVANN